MPIPDTPLKNVKFFDKWTHLAMYAALVLVIVLEHAVRRVRKAKSKAIRLSAEAQSRNAETVCDKEFSAEAVKPDVGRKRRALRAILIVLVAACAMGGLIELAQAYLTAGIRSGDWLDFAANSVGALLGAIIALPIARVIAR